MPRKRKTPAQVSAARRKAVLASWAHLTPEQRSERAAKAWRNISPERRSRIAKKGVRARKKD